MAPVAASGKAQAGPAAAATAAAADSLRAADQQQRSVAGGSVVVFQEPLKQQAALAPLQQQQAPQRAGAKPKRSGSAGFLCCFAPAVLEAPVAEGAQVGTPVINIRASTKGGPDTTWAHLPPSSSSGGGASSSVDEFEEFFDARSQASSFDLGGGAGGAAGANYQSEVVLSDFVASEHDQSSKQQHGKQQQQLLRPAAAVAAGATAAAATQQPPASARATPPNMIPNPPLMFAAEEGRPLEFVPVPSNTGFAGQWELIPERTTPHPQPIDVMCGASALVRRIHASLPGILIEEDLDLFKVIGQPAFIPKGIPSVHTEPYDKHQVEKISWWPRRDVMLGKAVGEVFYTADGCLILRSFTYPLLSKTPDYVVEDYLRLEEGGTVIVDRMCCHCTRTGRSAQQMQVVRKLVPPAAP